MSLSAGSIAFVGLNTDGNEGWAFVAIDAIAAGQTIFFTDRNWNGSSFLAGEGTLQWTAPAGGVAAGTVVELGDTRTSSPLASTGSVTIPAGLSSPAIGGGEVLYAVTGAVDSTATFLAAIGNTTGTGGGVLTNTGLQSGVTAALASSGNIMVYGGPQTFADRNTALTTINTTSSNWVTESTVADDSSNGTSPDTPFLTSSLSPLKDASFTICFYPGTRIGTPGGEVAVEDLRPGDLVLTADGRAMPVRWVGRQSVATRFADPLRNLPVRVAAGALGGGLPRRDLLVSPAHAIGLGRILAEAGALVNGTSIRREARAALPDMFTWHHVELATHALLLAEGAPAESFVDHVSPERFDNAAERAALLGDDVPPIPEMDLPRARSARQVPRDLRDRLDGIATVLGRQAAEHDSGAFRFRWARCAAA